MTTPPDEFTTFLVGDKDLYLLGVAAALTARWHMIRKGGKVPFPGFPTDDAHALGLVTAGIVMGAGLPLDDVPELWVSVHADRATLDRLRALSVDRIRGLEEDEGDDDDDVEWEEEDEGDDDVEREEED